VYRQNCEAVDGLVESQEWKKDALRTFRDFDGAWTSTEPDWAHGNAPK
jgi:hypothetical protein